MTWEAAGVIAEIVAAQEMPTVEVDQFWHSPHGNGRAIGVTSPVIQYRQFC